MGGGGSKFEVAAVHSLFECVGKFFALKKLQPADKLTDRQTDQRNGFFFSVRPLPMGPTVVVVVSALSWVQLNLRSRNNVVAAERGGFVFFFGVWLENSRGRWPDH